MSDYKLVPVEPEMLPCPFCGGTDAFVERQDDCSAYVVCSSMLDEHSCCYAQGPVGIQEDDGEEIPGATAAIAACNQRAAPDVQGEPVAFCEDAALSIAERTFSTDVDEQLASDIIQYAQRLHSLYAAPQPAEEQPSPLDDDSPAYQVGKIGNQIHNLGCEHQNDEELADRLAEIAHQAWMLQRSVVISKVRPAPDVIQLVEALEAAQKEAVRGINHARNGAQAAAALGRVSAIVGAALDAAMQRGKS